jgi:hypothetical protein
VGTVAGVADYFFDMQTIITDIDADADRHELVRWYDYCMEMHDVGEKTAPNYKNWLKGCPRKSPEEIEDIKRRVDELKRNFVF